MEETHRRRTVFALLLFGCVFVPIVTMGYKLHTLNYSLEHLIPAISYHVDINLQLDGHGEDISISTFLPKSDSRQTIDSEENAAGLFQLGLEGDGLNRVAQWTAENVDGRHLIRFSFSAQADAVRYEIPVDIPIPSSYPTALRDFLKDESGVQVSDPQIDATLRVLLPAGQPSLLQALTAIHRFLQDRIENRDFAGFTDAITALKLGEASCNGKSRLFLALARKLNIPSRLVGGIILQPGNKRTSHQWVEVYIHGHWVPFDTINDHFARIPANFLTLYYGDHVLFKHTSNINFQYAFKTLRKRVPRQELERALSHSPLNLLNVYALFENIGISQNLLKIVLMIPLGALVVVFFRNIVGLETFGTFLPALIAAASRETGLLWGLVGFIVIILVAAVLRRVLDWLHLLHSPKMSIMLTFVVIVMLAVSVAGVYFGLFDLAHVSLFPIAILAITAERFALIEAEQGLRKSLTITGVTLLVISACYWVMDSLFLQSAIIAFPELLLSIIAVNLWLGKWTGLRVTELFRFRRLIFQ